ncbi:MAG: peroxiredoxin-like family protein [Bacteroidota bacterium]
MNDQQQSLQAQLDARKASWAEKASDHVKRAYKEGIDAVVEAGVEAQAKQVGDQAPDFSLTNATGQGVSLSDQLNKGPVVLTWYRGGWCPYCNITLRQLQLELPNFQAKGASLLALTPELPDKSLSTQEKHSLEFEVLSDVGNEVARSYGIVFKLSEEVGEMYQNAFDLHAYNGDESKELPLAATYVIDTDGRIQYAFLDAEYRNRAEPAEILAILDKLNT